MAKWCKNTNGFADEKKTPKNSKIHELKPGESFCYMGIF